VVGGWCLCMQSAMGSRSISEGSHILSSSSLSKSPSSSRVSKRLTEDSMSQSLKGMEYAVRGEVVIAADRINADMSNSKESSSKYPFDHIVYTNIGNPHSVGQKPLTWPRQVMALADLPSSVGIDHPNVCDMFPEDCVRRARSIKEALNGHGTGAYTHSQGPKVFRDEIARFIERRDQLPSHSISSDSIFMTNGASSAIHMILTALISNPKCGVMIPIPQYPIYSATIDLLGGQKVGYYLNEQNGWDMNMDELEQTLLDAKNRGIHVNSFVLINPGNPTGNVLPPDAVKHIGNFCAKHNLVLLADEVYQENVYGETAKFFSCKRAAAEAGLLAKDSIELVSFHSTSKGIFGECGRRGGYMELTGIDPKVQAQLYKLASSGLCSNVPGQIMTSLMVNGPQPGDESYETHQDEIVDIFQSLKRRASIASEGFNSIDGFQCQKAQGAMYCFPSVSLPPAAIQAAAKMHITPDTLYAVSLLEKKGICVVPASGFGQKEGRIGFRTTFLPSEKEMKRVIEAVKDHHEEFCKKYSS